MKANQYNFSVWEKNLTQLKRFFILCFGALALYNLIISVALFRISQKDYAYFITQDGSFHAALQKRDRRIRHKHEVHGFVQFLLRSIWFNNRFSVKHNFESLHHLIHISGSKDVKDYVERHNFEKYFLDTEANGDCTIKDVKVKLDPKTGHYLVHVTGTGVINFPNQREQNFIATKLNLSIRLAVTKKDEKNPYGLIVISFIEKTK